MASFYFNTAASKNVRRTWLDFIEEKFGVSSVSSGDRATFAGDIRCSSLGFLTLAQIKATHQLGDSRAQVAQAQKEHFAIIVARAGRVKITQAGREWLLGPNMFTLFDCNWPYVFHQSSRPRFSTSSSRPPSCARG